MKVPRTLQSVAMDERELVMYNKIFPALQQFLGEQLYEDQEVDLPIPVIFASSFKGDGLHDFLVTENLRATNYFQVKHLMGDIYQLLGLGTNAGGQHHDEGGLHDGGHDLARQHSRHHLLLHEEHRGQAEAARHLPHHPRAGESF